MAKLTFNAILVICTGNICRSPTGERLLRRLLPAKRVDSAGICGLEGHAADSQAAEVAAGYGTQLEGHVARRLTPAMVRDYDLILAMELEHIEQVTAIAPEARGKMMLFGHWIDRKEIPDPYRKNRDAFEHVYGLLEQASQEWAKRLS
ncbi:protein tyrosine phosphatase [Pseudenterobacter timonensis]|uniref:protein-tyrosine-phosphatase n=1 Tax=Pseudenterobacter timonensis TaxID=1755099 RepID=A0AAE4DQW1_9ENTR|nr:protein tyrosine phosphatase [Pseudenterobacter timonensis]MDR9892042.1 protein tyrosine phosphatase [Pseudenterobacter timonensis]